MWTPTVGAASQPFRAVQVGCLQVKLPWVHFVEGLHALLPSGIAGSLLAKLGQVDAQIAAVNRRMDEQKPVDLTAMGAEIREFVSERHGSANPAARGWLTDPNHVGLQ